MRLIGQIQITMATAEAVNREPGFWDKLKRGLGGKVNLDDDDGEFKPSEPDGDDAMDVSK